MKTDISVDALHAFFSYNAETGALIWKPRKAGVFPCEGMSERFCASWNNRYAGKEVSCIDNKGYFVVSIFGAKYRAHRVIWAMQTGAWPSAHIDHKNRCRADNRMSNLRLATNAQNHANTGLSSSNKSGLKGVSWSKQSKRWVAMVGDNKYLGLFDCPAAASFAYQLAADRIYGEFARVA